MTGRTSLWICTALASLAVTSTAGALGSFSYSLWGSLPSNGSWQIFSGELSGDSRTDLVAYDTTTGNLLALTSTGASLTQSPNPWSTVSPAADWSFATGNGNGDGLADLFGYHPSDGSIWVGRNTGSGFSFSEDQFVSPISGWVLFAGDFGGDSLEDVALFRAATGEIRVGVNVAGEIGPLTTWLTVNATGAWTWTVGQIVPGGRAELVGLDATTGKLHLAQSNGASFTLIDTQAVLAVGPAWGLHAGDYDLDGIDDIFAYDPTTGHNYVGRTQGISFDFSLGPWGQPVAPPNGWTFLAGDFDGDGDADAMGHASSNDTLWFADREHSFDGIYAWPLSVAPGETIDFMASGATTGTIEFFKHASLSDVVDSTLTGSLSYTPTNQSIQAESWRYGAGWATSASLTIPSNWPSGYYSARITALDGRTFHASFVVKAAPGTSTAGVAVLANTHTWLAYNRWDGTSPGTHGRYTGEAHVSYLRPNPWTDPTDWQFETSHLTRAELWIFSWLEAQGYNPHLFSDFDLHDDLIPAEYDHIVIGTHPEYYTVEMYAQLEQHLAGGGSLLYLGGNGIFAITSFVPGTQQTEMYFLDGVQNGPRAPSLFRNQGIDDQPPAATMAERSLLGVATEACGVLGSPYRVLEPSHPLFEDAGVTQGTLFGTSGWNTAGGPFDGSAGGYRNGLASAFEVDSSAGPGALSCPTLCGCTAPGEDLVPPQSSLPQGLVLLARATGIEPATGAVTPAAEVTYYDHPGGGHVLSFGSITVGGSLVVDPVLQTMVHNSLASSAPGVPSARGWTVFGLFVALITFGVSRAHRGSVSG